MAEDKGGRRWWQWCRGCNDSEALYDNLRLIGNYEDGEDDIEMKKRHLMHPDILIIFPLRHKHGAREVDTASLFKAAFRGTGEDSAHCFPGMEAMRQAKSAPVQEVTRTVFSDLMNFMRDRGLLVEPFKSSDGRNVFARVSIIDAMCEEYALERRMKLKTTLSLLHALNIDQDADIVDPAWYEYEQKEYRKWLKQIRKRMEGDSAKTFELYQNYDEFDEPVKQDGHFHKHASLFRSVDRVSMIYDMIHEVINVQRLVEKGVIADVFPNHDDRRIEQFNQSWSSLSLLFDMRRQPLDAISSYFGLHMAMWFAWQGHTLRTVLHMIPFSMVAFIILQVAKIGDFTGLGRAAHIGNVAMLMIFTIYYRKSWHRRENELRVRWGLTDQPTLEAVRARPDYRGEKMTSPWDRNVKRRTYPLWKTRCAQVGSVVVGVLWCLLVSAVVVGFLSPHGEGRLRRLYPGRYQSTISGVLLSLQIKAFRVAWGYGVVPLLVYWENPRSDQDYLDSLVYKLVPFNFINSYYSFFYVAFFKDKKGCTHDGDCGAELEDLLYTTYLTLACFNFVGLLWPLFQVWLLNVKDRVYQWKAERNGNAPAAPCKPVLEANADKPRISQADQQRDFLALVLELGYAILFGSAAPIIFVPCSVLLIIGVRLNAWKYTNIYQRNRPYTITGIGAWGTVLDLMCGLGRISALAVAVFDLKELQFLSFSQKLLVIIVAKSTVDLLEMLVDALVGNFSSRTVLQLLQRSYVERKWRTWLYAQEQTRLPRVLAKVKDFANHWKQKRHSMSLDDTKEDEVAALDDREEGWTIKRKSRYWNTSLSEVGQ